MRISRRKSTNAALRNIIAKEKHQAISFPSNESTGKISDRKMLKTTAQMLKAAKEQQ